MKKRRILVYENCFSLDGEIRIGLVSATPNYLLKRLITRKRFTTKMSELVFKRDCSIEEQLPQIKEQLLNALRKL